MGLRLAQTSPAGKPVELVLTIRPTPRVRDEDMPRSAGLFPRQNPMKPAELVRIVRSPDELGRVRPLSRCHFPVVPGPVPTRHVRAKRTTFVAPRLACVGESSAPWARLEFRQLVGLAANTGYSLATRAGCLAVPPSPAATGQMEIAFRVPPSPAPQSVHVSSGHDGCR